MRLAALALLAAAAFGQEPPPPVAKPAVLEYTGKPLVLPFQCTREDTQQAGLECTEEAPCPVYLELDGVAASGDRIWLGGNLHSAAVTLFSTLLVSEDGGRTWREPADRVRFAGIDKLQFLDAETGWAAGERLSPLPQDPFLLLTNDGGKTWRMRAIFSESAENKLGQIQQFAFTTKDSGSLIIDRGQAAESDRYELYESPDGGESWSFRQSSQKPLTLRKPAAVSTPWRLRADSRTRAFHLEHWQANRWNGVAAFSVSIGACKP
jgi:photosystem II stability/assembly factor-like uncharacterized protein